MNIAHLLPLSYLSWALGSLANLPLPQPLASWTVRMFAKAYGIDAATCTRPLEEFRCIGEFFTRDIKPEERPCAGGFVCPVDGTLRSYQELSPGMNIPQVKGRGYTLAGLLGGDPLVTRLEQGGLWNMYLSPADAHHIFSPVSGTIRKTLHIPGKLWPVNDWALRSVEGLFAVNERVVTFIETTQGLVAVVMVGATNVGRISLRYMALETNLRPWAHKAMRVFDHEGIAVQAGEKIGTFKMGSSVLVVAEGYRPSGDHYITPHRVLFGQPL